MIINKIELNNIGPYLGGNNVLDLSTTNKKNILLIGGKNGAGKTTLLNSIKVGLFGTYAYGLKTENDTYYNQLYNVLNYNEMSKEFAVFSIKIHFEMIESFKKNNYILERSWNKDGFSIKENICVIKNNKNMDKISQLMLLDKLKEIMPPYLIDTMLFDGEKIANIINEGKTSEYIKQLVDINFNMNVLDKLSDDMNYYIAKEKNKKGMSSDEISLIEYQDKYKEHERNIKNYEKLKSKNEALLQQLKFKNERKFESFKNYDGLSESEKKELESKLSSIEAQNQEDKRRIKSIFENEYPLLLNRVLIQQLIKTVNKSKPSLYLKYIDQIEKYISSPEINKIREELNKKVDKNHKEIIISSEQEIVIKSAFAGINEFDLVDIGELYESSKKSSTNFNNIKQIIKINEESRYEELSEMLDALKKVQQEIDEVKQNIIDLDNKIIEEEHLYELALTQYEIQESKLDNNNKEKSSFNIASKIRRLVDEYKNVQLNQYLEKISLLTIKKFQEVNKKKDYLTAMSIDEKTYEITLKDNNNKTKKQVLLSAGEKQLLISSIIWSIFKLSGRNNIFIFDTPLARLDKENRGLFVKHILSTISTQVLVLSTDQEIVGDVYKSIKTLVNRTYLIENNPARGKTQIEEGYFSGGKNGR